MADNTIPELAALERQLVTLISERLLETPPDFGVDSNLYEAGLDSMAIMQFLLLLEEQFGLTLPESDLSRQNFTDIRSLAGLVRERLAERQK